MNRLPPLPLPALLLSLLAVSCSDADRSTPATLDQRALEKVGSQHLPCQDGATRSCSLTLSEHEGLISCYEGTRYCRLSSWGECSDGREFSFQRTLEPLGSINFKAFNDPSECTDNPCNSYCREFIEGPPEGLVADTDPNAEVQQLVLVGDLDDYPEDLAAQGIKDPCQEASDCQIDSVCTDPGVGSCNHSACRVGGALAANCNRCTTTICDLNPNCCGPTVECAHDPCQTGVALVPACDTCVQTICDAHPECCDLNSAENWGSTCVDYVQDECSPLGQQCDCPEGGSAANGTCYSALDTPMEWSLAGDTTAGCLGVGVDWGLAEPRTQAVNAILQELAASVPGGIAWIGAQNTSNGPESANQWTWKGDLTPFYVGDDLGGLEPGHPFESWADSRPQAGSVSQAATINASGAWDHDTPSTEHPAVCSGPANTLSPRTAAIGWGESCVELAKSACGITCPNEDPIGLGACVTKVASELDPQCLGYELTIGATCETGGIPQIPICNHGQTASPTDLVVRFYSDSDVIGQLDPDPGAGETCTLSESIPPGRCVVLDDCLNIKQDDAIIVNPRTGENDTSECRFDNNWSLYDSNECTAPICEASAHSAPQVALANCEVAISNPLNLSTDDARVSLATGIPEPGCGLEEVMWGNSCYHFATSPRNWLTARNNCQNRGGGWELIAINSPQENEFSREGFGPGFFAEFHLGLNDLVNEGSHVWSNGSCTAYENWSVDDSSSPTGKGVQPNDLPAGANGCTRMFTDDAWGDTACSPAAFQYVCEGPVRDPQGGCSAGQLTGPDGDCYFVDTQLRSWPDAEIECKTLGTGWGLADIRDHGVNEFAVSLTGCDSVWIDKLSTNFSSEFLQSEILPGSADFKHEASISATGQWELFPLKNGEEKFALCQGPSISIGTPPLTLVASPASCTTDSTRQYFFNGDFFGGTEPENFTPDSLQLCPTTCESAQLEPGNTRLDVSIPCALPAPPTVPTTHEIFYETDCREGGAQWDFLYYDAVTPANSRIEFAVRTGRDEDSILSDDDSYIEVATAQALPIDTQRCEINPPNCPLDLFTLLGNPGYQREVLQLRISMVPGTNGEGPVLRDWKVRFSCPPGE